MRPNTTGSSCCCCAPRPHRACATTISPSSKRSPQPCRPTTPARVADVARGATVAHWGWGRANEQRSKLRYLWHDFFQKYDVLLAPVAATAAFPHDHNPDRGARRVTVNGEPMPHVDILWAGLASLCYLPATAAPLGLTARGLPVGLQIIGPEGEDPTTIEFARLLADEIGGFVAPPGYE